MSVTSWTDFGMNWADPDPTEGYYIEALAAAINERCLLAGRPTISVPDLHGSGNYFSRSLLGTIHATIQDAIWSYANHTDSAGEWDKKKVVPAWTYATIYNEMGDPEAYGSPSGIGIAECFSHTAIRNWLKQQYALINLLRYHVRTQSVELDPGAEVKGRNKDGSTAAAALAEYATLPWRSESNLLGHYFVYQGGYFIARHSNTYTIANVSKAVADMDVYCPFSAVGGGFTYQNQEYPDYAEGMYKKLLSGTAINPTYTLNTGVLNHIDGVTVATPGEDGGFGWYLIPSARVVYKTDFAFKDW